MIPPAQLFDGDSEAVGDCDQSVAAANGVTLRAAICDRGGDGDYEFISRVEAIAQSHAICLGDVACMGMECSCDAIERLAGANDVKTPTASFVFWNLFDALGKDVVHAHRNVQVERHITRGCHPQQAWVERDDLEKRGVGDIGNESKIDGVVDGDGVGDNRRVGDKLVEPVLRRGSLP